jgi:hypothetical protein
MQAGFPDYGCRIQTEKTLTNFEAAVNVETEFTFFGSRIDSRSFACRPDFASYHGANIVYAASLTCASDDPETISKYVNIFQQSFC